jgi:hypothetical protein
MGAANDGTAKISKIRDILLDVGISSPIGATGKVP